MTTFTFTFYCELQDHLAKRFDHLVSEANTTQEEFWDTMRISSEPTEYRRRAEAFIDGLQHNFSKLGLVTSEYLIDGVWTPIAKTPAGRLCDSDCRLVWKKTGVVYGEIPLTSRHPQARLLDTQLSLEKAPKPETV